jgi:hypothetical protein
VSVDISQLTARLDQQRQEAVKQQYEERATNPTAAFLLCFFLGSAGAHRFFLREWRAAFGHLALFAAGVVALVAGLIQTLPLPVNLASHPLGAALDALGVALLLAALIWEIIDLGHIDHQVYQRNLLLAEGIIAGTLLADHSLIEEARQRLSTTSRKARAQAQAAALAPSAAAPAPAAPAAPVAGIITADEVADARALAEENAGFATISYAEMSRFDISEDPDQARQASADAAHEGNWSESVTTAETAPDAAPEAPPVTETVTRTHSEDGPRVTDSYEVDRVAGPSAAEAAGLGAAGLGAAALGAGLLGADHTAGFDEPTQPDHAQSAADAASAIHAYDPSDAQPAAPAAAPAFAAAAYQSDQAHTYDFADDDIGDVTDASMPAVVAPPADIAVAHASPAYVQLPDEQPAQDAPLYLIPDEPTTAAYPYAPEPGAAEPVLAEPVAAESAFDAPPSEEPTAEAYVPPVASVYSSPTEAPVAPTPSWDQPAVTQPEPQPAHDDTLAELAGFGGVAGAGALAGEALAHERAPEPVVAAPTPEPAAAMPTPAAPKMKKIRVRRKVVVDGQVVAEEVVEREVPADMDTAEAAAQIQAELAHYTPEQIAQRAHLAPDESVELHQRTEGPGGAQ